MKEIEEKLRNDNSLRKFAVNSIQVWSTEGPVEEWFLMETIPLTGDSCVPDLVKLTDVSPENTLSKEEGSDLYSSFLDTTLLGQKLASALMQNNNEQESISSCSEHSLNQQ